MNSTIKYPLLSIHETSGEILVNYTLEQLSQCSIPTLKTNFFKELILIDSEGQQFEVKRVGAILSKRPSFWDFSFLKVRMVTVELEIVPCLHSANFMEIKHMIVSLMSDESWESCVGIDEIRIQIEQATNIVQLIEILKIIK